MQAVFVLSVNKLKIKFGCTHSRLLAPKKNDVEIHTYSRILDFIMIIDNHLGMFSLVILKPVTVNTRKGGFCKFKNINTIQNREGFSSLSCTCELVIIPSLHVTELNENVTCARDASVEKCIVNCVCEVFPLT